MTEIWTGIKRLGRTARVTWRRRIARRGGRSSVRDKQIVIAVLGIAFLISLIFVQGMEVARQRRESAEFVRHPAPASSRGCVECHQKQSPGIVDHWAFSTHAAKGVGCVECHKAEKGDVDGFDHHGWLIATIVTPRDCSRCHPTEGAEFARSHHAHGGKILASLDNFLAETVEGNREPFKPFNPHAAPIRTPGGAVHEVNGMASAFTGCQQCHGSKVGFESTDGGMITVDDLKPGAGGKPAKNLDSVRAALARIVKDQSGKPKFHQSTWPNTGIGRINLDGSLGSCSACHSRHDFSPRRARQPENCGKCHLGPDHPQKEIYEESKHGVAFRDLKDHMNLNAEEWVLGKDYSQAPTCATCHMSGHTKNGGRITHDPGERISWSNRPPVSVRMDTDLHHNIVKTADEKLRAKLVTDTAEDKRARMRSVCLHCHTSNYVNAFYKQYDDFVVLYNEKFAKPGQAIIGALRDQKLITPTQFDEEIEWTWFYLWHHEGRRARHGASMMAPDYAHWHGMYEVAERFYQHLIPQARHIADEKAAEGKTAEADTVRRVINDILNRPEHAWKKDEAALRSKKKPKPKAKE